MAAAGRGASGAVFAVGLGLAEAALVTGPAGPFNRKAAGCSARAQTCSQAGNFPVQTTPHVEHEQDDFPANMGSSQSCSIR
jgi:hypothetical protein